MSIRYGPWITPAPVVIVQGLDAGTTDSPSAALKSILRTRRVSTPVGVGTISYTFPQIAEDLNYWRTQNNGDSGHVAADIWGDQPTLSQPRRLGQTWAPVVLYLDDRFSLSPTPPTDPTFGTFEWDTVAISGSDVRADTLNVSQITSTVLPVTVNLTCHLDRDQFFESDGMHRVGTVGDDTVEVYADDVGTQKLIALGGVTVATLADSLPNVDYDTDTGGIGFMVRDGLLAAENIGSFTTADHMLVDVNIPVAKFHDYGFGVGTWVASIRLASGRQLTLTEPNKTGTDASGLVLGDFTALTVNGDGLDTQPYTVTVTWQPPRYRAVYSKQARLRQFPRDDQLGGSPRQGNANGSTSVQGSTRQGWRGTYR